VAPRTRLVTHLDVSRDDVARTVAAFSAFFTVPLKSASVPC